MPVYFRDIKSLSKEGGAKLKGDVTLSQGANITLTQTGQDIKIAAIAGATGGATTALDNLDSVAINSSLLVDTDSTYDLGSTTAQLANVHTDRLVSTLANLVIENDLSDGDISFKVNDGGVDTTVMTLDGATGRVGIGTTSPQKTLEVNGQVRFSQATTSANAEYYNTNTVGYTAFDLFDSNNAKGGTFALSGPTASFLPGAFWLGPRNGNPLYFTTQSTPAVRMTILDGGNVGIGTTTPTGKLDVVLSGADAVKFQVPGSTEGGITFYDATNRVDLTRVGNTLNVVGSAGYPSGSVMTVDAANSRVGIGTTSPTTPLHLRGEPAGATFLTIANSGASGKTFTLGVGTSGTEFVSTGTLNFQSTTSYARFLDSTGEVMRITSGNVGIGTTGPGEKLAVEGNLQLGSAENAYINMPANVWGDKWYFAGSGIKMAMDQTSTSWLTTFGGSTGLTKFRWSSTKAGGINGPILDLETGGNAIFYGNVGIGTTAPTAVLHLKAGTATASTAPLKFTSGTLNTTAEAGAVEFLTDAFYGTITTGAARKTFAFLESPSFTGTVTLPTGLTGVLRADSGVVSIDSDVTDIVAAATTTAAGKVELAIASEVDTGTDDTRAVTPDSLAGSNIGTRVIQLKIFDDATALAIGDGKMIFCIPSELNGMNLVNANAYVTTVSTSGTPTVMIRNVTDTQDMLSTAITIDASEFTSYTAATPSVINTTYDDVATGDRIAIDVDGAGTGAKGLGVILSFRLP